MRQKRFKDFILLSCLVTFFCFNLAAQTTISGPVCVIPGITFQYIINGKWTSASTMQICIKNGKLEASGNTCYKGNPVSFVRVIWDNSGTNGAVSLTSSDGNATQNIKITRPLRAGIVDASSVKQVIDYNKTPDKISCSPALWGSCNPVFSYQWQQSTDRVKWVDIGGENNKSFKMSNPLTQTTFFRRKVTETTSTTIGFSEVAEVNVKARTN